MSRFSIIEKPSCELWNSFLNNSVNGNFEQTFEYGEIMKVSRAHTRVARLLAMDYGKPVGIIQGIYSEMLGFGASLKVGGGHGNAPVTTLEGKERALLVRVLLGALVNFGLRKRIIGLEVWWPISWGMHDIFRDLKYTLTSKFNQYTISLDKPVKDLWNSLASNKRKNIKKAIKQGVEVVQGHNYEDLLSFYRMLEASGERAVFTHPPFSEFEATWKFYKPSKVFLAKWRGKDVAGVFTVIHGNTVYARAAGSLRDAWNARPNDLLHWKVMEWACERRLSKYHMGLVTEPVPTEGSNTWGLWRWKREWNGNLETVQVFNKFLYLPEVMVRSITGRYEYLTPHQQRIVSRLFRFLK